MSIAPIEPFQTSPATVQSNTSIPEDNSSNGVLIPLDQAIQNLSKPAPPNQLGKQISIILGTLFSGLVGGYAFLYYNKLAYGEANKPLSGQDRLFHHISESVDEFIQAKDYSKSLQKHKLYDTCLLRDKILEYIHHSEKNIFTRWWKFCQIGLQSTNGKKILSSFNDSIDNELINRLYEDLKRENKLAHQDKDGFTKFCERTKESGRRAKRYYL